MRLPLAIGAILLPGLAAAAPPVPVATISRPATASARVNGSPLFSLAIGDGAALAGEEQGSFLPCGSGPSSFEVDGEGRWWILDAIGNRVVVAGRDGSIVRTLPLPASGKKKPSFFADLALDGTGGTWVLDATARRVIHMGGDGSITNSFGGERVPHGKGPQFDLPKRIALSDGTLVVEDGGSDALFRFAPDGTFRGATLAPDAIAVTGGGVFDLSQNGGTTWLESAAEGGHRRPIAKLSPAEGRELRDSWLVGSTASGELVLAQLEAIAGKDEPARTRILRVDAKGKILAEREIAVESDGASPTRRVRLAPSGMLAHFRIEAGRFQAFETAW